MSPQSRRRFIKQTGIGVAALTTAPSIIAADNSSQVLHREQRVPGVHVYSTQESVRAGEDISFCVSADTPYEFSVARLGHDPNSPAKDEVLRTFEAIPPRVQPIHPGSYILVENGLKESPAEFTIECWLRPWAFDRWQDVISQMTYPEKCDFAVAINPEGLLTFYLGDGGKFNNDWPLSTDRAQLTKGQWHHIVMTKSRTDRRIWMDGKIVAGTNTVPAHENIEWSAPLRLGAGGNADGTASRTADYIDGDISMPVLYSRSLSEAEIKQRFSAKGLVRAKGKDVLACWSLNEERGDRVRDESGNRRHGNIINHATWMIGGPGFDPDVPRFGNHDPARDPKRGHGIRFASDDLYDCHWDVTHRYKVPRDAKSGIYVGRLRFEQEGAEHLQHVTFIVRKPTRRKKAPILVLCATNTWRAYSGTQFGKTSAQLKQVFGTNGTENSAGDPPAFNFYRAHAAGQGTYQQGLRMPWPAAGPYVLYGGATNYSHLMRAERFAHIWLEQAGYEFDVITDHDLHRDPDQLRGYETFLINGHSEYWSFGMYRGLEKYLADGGNAIVLSGNSLFWRVSYNDDGTILECRKADAPGNQVPADRRGEAWHSHDGLRGGLANECGMPGWKLIGLTTLGWNNQGNPKNFGPYVAEQTDHFLFNEPEQVDLQPGHKFGWTGNDNVTPLANGHEFDVRLSTLAALQEQLSPEGLTVPADPEGMTRLANGIIPWKEGGAAFDYWFNPINPKTDQGGEMIYWERPNGGRVFNAGSIGSGWALWADPKLQTLMRNVLYHFGVPHKNSD
jgi:hypothetical protein